jgi:flagellar M-ring protein FliF
MTTDNVWFVKIGVGFFKDIRLWGKPFGEGEKMPDFIKKIIDNIKTIWGKLTIAQKLIGGGVILAVIVAIVIMLAVNSTSAGVPLFVSNVDVEDFGKITKKLQEQRIPFTVKGDSVILMRNQVEKNKSLMMLSQEGMMPKGKYTFLDIIKNQKITTDKFTNNAQLRAALAGKLEELLESSELVDKAQVNFTMPEQQVFIKDRSPVKVAVMLTPKYGVNLSENKKAIQGIQDLVVNSIDRAEPEYVTITDNYGVKLNDFSGEQDEMTLKKTKENLKIRDAQIASYREKIYSGVTKIIDPDRVSILVDVQMNFNEEVEKRKEVLPVVIRPDNPETPYDDSEIVPSVTISKKTTSEKFNGPNWIPEGPPGYDSNVPPAYKGALEQMTEYLKNEEIVNEVTGESNKEIKKDPWEITKISASVAVDGTYEIQYDNKNKPLTNPDGTRKRKYIPVGDNVIKNIKGFVEQGVGYSAANGFKVEVYELQKDRSAQFKKEDDEWNRRNQITIALIAGLFALIVLIIATILYRVIAKELERKKRLREEELARQHQLAREMALKSAEAENVDVEMSQEDKARLEMQENAINLSREHPEEVAQLIRTWLTEE